MKFQDELATLLCFVIIATTPLSITAQKNYHTQTFANNNITVANYSYRIEINFLDQFDNLCHFSMTYPLDQTDKMIGKFGISKKMFEPYIETSANRNSRIRELSEGLFRLDREVVEVDKNAVVAYYSELFCRPIAQQIAGTLARYGKDTRLNRIEMAMCFVQDIPYGVPKYTDDSRHYGGLNTPPKLLLDMSGDCDSKALLFAGILIYLIPADDIIFLNQPEHVLTAIKSEPEKGKTVVKYKNATYLIAETAGPGRRLLGEKGNYFRNSFKAEPLLVKQPDIIPFQNETKPEYQNQKPKVVLKNLSDKSFGFQLSTDQIHWSSVVVEPTATEIISFDDVSLIFVKPKDRQSRNSFYNFSIGKAYSVDWNAKKRIWEVYE